MVAPKPAQPCSKRQALKRAGCELQNNGRAAIKNENTGEIQRLVIPQDRSRHMTNTFRFLIDVLVRRRESYECFSHTHPCDREETRQNDCYYSCLLSRASLSTQLRLDRVPVFVRVHYVPRGSKSRNLYYLKIDKSSTTAVLFLLLASSFGDISPNVSRS